jgi:hypothetical protein
VEDPCGQVFQKGKYSAKKVELLAEKKNPALAIFYFVSNKVFIIPKPFLEKV